MKNQILACGFIPNTESLELLDHCERVLQQERASYCFQKEQELAGMASSN